MKNATRTTRPWIVETILLTVVFLIWMTFTALVFGHWLLPGRDGGWFVIWAIGTPSLAYGFSQVK